MRPNKLRELLKSNKPTLSTHIHTTWPSVVEPTGHTGLHFPVGTDITILHQWWKSQGEDLRKALGGA